MSCAVSHADDPLAGTAGEISAALADLFKQHGASDVDAADAAARVTKTVCWLFGGRSIYLPRLERLKAAERNREIVALANGRNTKQIAARHGLSDRHVQRIVAAQARAYRAERSAIQKPTKAPR